MAALRPSRFANAAKPLPRFLFPQQFKTDFTWHNLPFGVFAKNGEERACVALGDKVIDLVKASELNLIKGFSFQANTKLNPFMAAGKSSWSSVRSSLQELLLDDGSAAGEDSARKEKIAPALLDMSEVSMVLPVKVGDYTDFYASREHATNVGIMFRSKENALMPNWLRLPVGYHGRASSVAVSGSELKRPHGQIVPRGETEPKFGPTNLLDIELEMAAFVGKGNERGDPIRLKDAEDQLFGVALMNDWSARDIQKWEYQPLGPFLGKNFLTTVSPWIVTMEALEPFRVATPAQGANGDPTPLDYLKQPDSAKGGIDINLQVNLKPHERAGQAEVGGLVKDACKNAMDGADADKISKAGYHQIATSNMKYMYWSLAQQVTHHSANGCNMQPGDVLGTGTISGPTEGEYGSMLELNWAGSKEIECGGGIKRKFLQDGDSVALTGYCEKGDVRVGFGVCEGTVSPAVKY